MKPADDAAAWAALRAAFDDVVGGDDAERAARLEEASRSDSRLRDQLEDLLTADASADQRLARFDRLFGAGAAPSPDPLGMTGRTAGHFRITAPLASGGMGIVYRAEDTRLRRSVALKFPLPALHIERETRERFLREARSAAALDHPNICSIYEAGETEDGQLFLAMPLYEGETLKARLSRVGVIEPAEALDIARQITLGVRAAHAAGIVHRDLKPANVMLLPDGTVKLLDFGLARMHDLTLTATGTAVGTVAYMAPEQVRGQRVDRQADLWAIGVMLYEMTTGRRPFEGETNVAVVYSILETEPAPPSSLKPELPATCDRLVAALLRKHAAERLSSASMLAEELGSPGSTPALSQGMPRPRWAGMRFSRRAAAAALAAGVVIIGGVATAAEYARNRSEAQSAANLGAGATPRLVAVLPFRNVAGDTAHDYLAIGLSATLGMQLSWLQSLTVPRYHVVSRYADPDVVLQDAARELKAAAVVFSTVDRIGDRIVLEMQLVDSAAGARWSRRFERPAAQLNELPRDVLAALTSAMRLGISDEERARLARPSTVSAAAYDLYLRGRAAEYTIANAIEAARAGQAFYARARSLDPNFALARALLADSYHFIGTTGLSQTHVEQARIEAEAALRIDSLMPEAHEALAWYWRDVGNDTARAIAELQLAIRGAPNDVYHRLRLGNLYRDRAMWAEALPQYEQAMRVDPTNAEAAEWVGVMYSRLRRYEEAVATFGRVLDLRPHDPRSRIIRGHMVARWLGIADSLTAAARDVGREFDRLGNYTWARVQAARMERRWQDVLVALDESTLQAYSGAMGLRPWTVMRGEAYAALNDPRRSRSEYEKARAAFSDSVRAHPADARYRIPLGLAYAGLGMQREAIAEARGALESARLSMDNMAAAALMGGAVEVFARAGAADAAFEQLDILLTIPAGREVSVPLLLVDPTYDPLRADPRFDRLVRRFSQ